MIHTKHNIKLSPYLIMNHAKQVYGSEVIVPLFFTSALDGREWSASCPDPFTPEERAHSTHGWAPVPAWTLQITKISFQLGLSSLQPVIIPNELSRRPSAACKHSRGDNRFKSCLKQNSVIKCASHVCNKVITQPYLSLQLVVSLSGQCVVQRASSPKLSAELYNLFIFAS